MEAARAQCFMYLVKAHSRMYFQVVELGRLIESIKIEKFVVHGKLNYIVLDEVVKRGVDTFMKHSSIFFPLL